MAQTVHLANRTTKSKPFAYCGETNPKQWFEVVDGVLPTGAEGNKAICEACLEVLHEQQKSREQAEAKAEEQRKQTLKAAKEAAEEEKSTTAARIEKAKETAEAEKKEAAEAEKKEA